MPDFLFEFIDSGFVFGGHVSTFGLDTGVFRIEVVADLLILVLETLAPVLEGVVRAVSVVQAVEHQLVES